MVSYQFTQYLCQLKTIALQQHVDAFLLSTYKSEFDLTELPVLVKKAVLPAICFIGKCLGKYKKFMNAPAPL